jgi:hypothetical protein
MKKTLLSFAIALIAVSLMAQSTANLRLNLEKNKVYKFKSTSEQTITQTVNGIQQTTGVNSNSTVSIKMVDATPEMLIAEVRFDTIVTITNAMGKIATISSASEGNIASQDASEVMSFIMNRLSRNPLYTKLDYSGKVIEIVNAQMLSEMILKDTALITGATAPVIKMQIKNLTGIRALKSMVASLTNNLPGKEVAKGDSWDVTLVNNSGGMSLDIVTSYTLEEINDHTAEVSAESNIKPSDHAEPMQYSGATIRYDDIKGLGKSNMVFDTLTGLIRESSGKIHLAGNLNVSVQTNNLQIPFEMDGESKVVALP